MHTTNPPSSSRYWAHALLLASLAFAPMAMARNISTEQANASEARAHYNQAKAALDTISQQITLQARTVADASAKLEKMKQKQTEAAQALEDARNDLAAKDKILNDVWDSRDTK